MKRNNWFVQQQRAIVSQWIASEEGRLAIEAEIERQLNEFNASDSQDFDCNKLFMKLKKRIEAPRGGARIRRYIRYAMESAAAIFIILFISLHFKEKETTFKEIPQFVEVYNPKGVRTTITLPDSSIVILNADSKISYTDKFEGKTRAVTLTGEAYFEVAKERSRPFVVYAHSATLTVLGTHFNVRAYPEDTHTQATLIEGALKVNDQLLAPGKQIIIDNSSKESTLQEVNPESVIGWTKGELYFQSTTFAEIATILGRKFSIHIYIENKELQERAFNGKFTKEESLEQILNVMQQTIDFTRRYEPERNELIIK